MSEELMLPTPTEPAVSGDAEDFIFSYYDTPEVSDR